MSNELSKKATEAILECSQRRSNHILEGIDGDPDKGEALMTLILSFTGTTNRVTIITYVKCGELQKTARNWITVITDFGFSSNRFIGTIEELGTCGDCIRTFLAYRNYVIDDGEVQAPVQASNKGINELSSYKNITAPTGPVVEHTRVPEMVNPLIKASAIEAIQTLGMVLENTTPEPTHIDGVIRFDVFGSTFMISGRGITVTTDVGTFTYSTDDFRVDHTEVYNQLKRINFL
jgi:hypothetical protein